MRTEALYLNRHPAPQRTPVLQELRGTRQTFWPVMAWGMYRHAHDPTRPIQTSLNRIVAITAGGEPLYIGPTEVGLGYFAIRRFYLGPMSTGDPRPRVPSPIGSAATSEKLL